MTEPIRKLSNPSRRQELSNAQALLRVKNSHAGRVILGMMNAREQQLREDHYASDDPLDLGKVGENKGAYSELMFWRTMLFDSLPTEDDHG